MDFNELLSRYAQLIVVHGLNVQKEQMVNLAGEISQRELLYLIAEAAYDQGAAHVHIDFIEPRLSRLRVEKSSEEHLEFVPAYLEPKYRELVERGGANLRLTGAEFPDILADLDPVRINRIRTAQRKAVNFFYEEGIEKARVHWTVAAAATPGWAQKVFRGVEADQAQAQLWDEIFKICRVDRPDFLEAWKEHNSLLQSRAAALTEMGIELLCFQGPGTDLSVGLSERAIFKGGSDTGPHGVEFEPNIPTEECFTTPDYRKTEGRVKATRPFLVNGQLIEDLEIEFRGGEIVDFSASQGAETYQTYIETDEGARRLGEVALVGVDSPVFQSGLVFEEILFDENAACHIAIGSAYKFCVKDGDSLSKTELAEIGCNDSLVHTDMMISNEEVDVVAKLRNGEEVTLIEKGSWKWQP